MGLGASSEQPAGGEGFHLHGVSRGAGRAPGRAAQPRGTAVTPLTAWRGPVPPRPGAPWEAQCTGLWRLVSLGKVAGGWYGRNN